mmetsp:Transcript_42230/g.92077  ORF Transcript_42230/g.92077 Transcript_42230/m.92077 type:complete len:201 (-) Transcript_42230:807-1409(-)
MLGQTEAHPLVLRVEHSIVFLEHGFSNNEQVGPQRGRHVHGHQHSLAECRARLASFSAHHAAILAGLQLDHHVPFKHKLELCSGNIRRASLLVPVNSVAKRELQTLVNILHHLLRSGNQRGPGVHHSPATPISAKWQLLPRDSYGLNGQQPIAGLWVQHLGPLQRRGHSLRLGPSKSQLRGLLVVLSGQEQGEHPGLESP